MPWQNSKALIEGLKARKWPLVEQHQQNRRTNIKS